MGASDAGEGDAVIFLRDREGAHGRNIEVPLGNGIVPIPNLDVARYVAMQTAPQQIGDIRVAFRFGGELHPIV